MRLPHSVMIVSRKLLRPVSFSARDEELLFVDIRLTRKLGKRFQRADCVSLKLNSSLSMNSQDHCMESEYDMVRKNIMCSLIVVAVMLGSMGICTAAQASVTETKRGISLTDSKVSGYAGGIETRSWAELYSPSWSTYVYAVQDGVYSGSGAVSPGSVATTISVWGSWDMSNDDALGGPLDNGSCYPSWLITPKERCGRPKYINYPKLGI